MKRLRKRLSALKYLGIVVPSAMVLLFAANTKAAKFTDEATIICGDCRYDGVIVKKGTIKIKTKWGASGEDQFVNRDPTNALRFLFSGKLDPTQSSNEFSFSIELDSGDIVEEGPFIVPVEGTYSGVVTKAFATASPSVSFSFSVIGPSLSILDDQTGPFVFENDFSIPADLSVDSIDPNFAAPGSSFSFSGMIPVILDFPNYRANGGGPLTGVDVLSGVVEVASIPEPSTDIILGEGLGLVLLYHFWRRRKDQYVAILRPVERPNGFGGYSPLPNGL